MSNSYLDKFRSTLPRTQGTQILKLLTSQRDSGKIRTLDEFKNRLKELTTTLLEKRITPTLELFRAELGKDISSEQYNFMMERIQDDLESAFIEADNLDEIINAHDELIKRVSLKILRYSLNELESRISFYEFLNKTQSSYGFNEALFNTFRSSDQLLTNRSDPAAALMYVDPRLNETIVAENDAFIDSVGERLLLGPEELNYVTIKKVEWLSNSNSFHGEVSATFSNENINAIIDNKKNTFWIVPILLSSIQSGGVPVQIGLTMPLVQDINFLEIEPASEYPIYLTDIKYRNTSGSIVSLSSFSSLEITGSTRLNIERITTDYIILQFSQIHYKEIQYLDKTAESNFHKALNKDRNNSIDLTAVSQDLQKTLTSGFILDDVLKIPSINGDVKKYYQYNIGFDNIRMGLNTYQEKSIYVARKVKTVTPGYQIAIKTIETRPAQSDGSAISQSTFSYPSRSSTQDSIFYHGSIEYWLTIQQLSADGFLVSTDRIPILPLGAKRIYHEQVIFTHKTSSSLLYPNMASLIFFTEANNNDVLVYRNGSLLSYGPTNDWDFVTTNEQIEITQTSPGITGRRMIQGIKILNDINPLDIYTVSYTPKVSNTYVIPAISSTLTSIVDLVGDQSIRMVRENIIVFDKIRLSNTITNTEIYLSILLRRNSAEANWTPAIEEFMLLLGDTDINKFTTL